MKRCAIYTRKSSEEGLEQSFNSLDAQREACAAYVLSQTHEGWQLLADLYDDGGYSGGSMNRPGLAQLMADVRAGKVDIIIVYKVDRLTRSLADFARIVDVLDQKGASFVSVTQAFNTTSSMGRLTLNVLLSFAQFEREVTAERIRDKVAASKARGLWMGGVVPLGYTVQDRALVVVPDEAARVRHIFSRYLALGSVYALQAELTAQGICTKARTTPEGKTGGKIGGKIGGNAPFSRGGLYQMLRNPLYRGQISHKGRCYPGLQEAIISPALFSAVAQLLDANRVSNREATYAEHPSPLAGLLWDDQGRRMSPAHSSKRGVRYRYYVSVRDKARPAMPLHRVPAGDLETLVHLQLVRHEQQRSCADRLAAEAGVQTGVPQGAGDAGNRPLRPGGPDGQAADALGTDALLTRPWCQKMIARVIVHKDRVEIQPRSAAAPLIVQATLVRRSGAQRFATADMSATPARADPALIRLIVRAHQARKALADRANANTAQAAASMGISPAYFTTLLRLSYLAPDISCAILDGRQPARLNRQHLARLNNLPLDWSAQRQLLGFTPAGGADLKPA